MKCYRASWVWSSSLGRDTSTFERLDSDCFSQQLGTMKFGSFTSAHPFLDSVGSIDLDQGSEGALSADQASAPDVASFLITSKRLQISSASYS